MGITHEVNHLHSLVQGFLGKDFLEEMIRQQAQPPLIDVYMKKKEVLVVIDLPGVEDFHTIQTHLTERKLIIQGKFPSLYYGYESNYSERRKGDFRREITLPVQVDPKKMKTRYFRGVLELRFLRKESESG